MRLQVVIPAHNEAGSIEATIASVREQSVLPDLITVVVDNCSDDTATLASRAGADVFHTVDNTQKKAGALNQLLDQLDHLRDDDVILVMDADTRLAPTFVETSLRLLEADAGLAAVGGVFVGDQPSGWLGMAQANEYARYARDVARHAGRVLVLTGTASAFRVEALREVAASRGDRLPGAPGQVYDVAALTEDNEITLALKHLGWALRSPKQCQVWTELMPTVGDLHRQRLRWYRGAVDNLRSYGWTSITRRYWMQQGTIALSVLIFSLLILLTVLGLVTRSLQFSPVWSLVGIGFLVERIVTAWRTGMPRARAMSALLFPEIAYDLVLQFTFLRAATQALRGTTPTWHHHTVALKENV